MERRTILDFTAGAEVWPVVDEWAKETGFSLIETSGTQRLYQKGKGFFVAPMMFQIDQSGDQIHIETWIRFGWFTRMQSLFMLPAELEIISGGLRGVAPRGVARKAVNKLLERLNQTPIA